MGEIPRGQPQRDPFVRPPLPTNRREQKQERPFRKEENLSTILDFLPPFLQTMPRTCNLQSALPWHLPASRDAGTGRNPPANLPGSGTAMFFFPRAACGAGCILHNRTKPHQGSSPSLRRTPISCQLSLGITGMQRRRRKGDFFWQRRGIREI